MNVSGEFTVNAPRDVLFKTLRDPSSFVRFVDGVSDLKEVDPTHYTAVFETKVAYLKFKFNVTSRSPGSTNHPRSRPKSRAIRSAWSVA
jgi:carbon monoxide dehydrogenase subunit G